MAKKKKIIKNVEVGPVATDGKCIIKDEGMVIFVEKVAPGDVVDVRITRKKKNFAEATPVNFHEYSKSRQDPFCSHFGTCGGCKWQHLAYKEQLFYKRQQVIDQLERIGGVSLPEVKATLPSEGTTYYRNKLEYTFSDKRWLTNAEIQTGEELDRRGVGFHIPGRFDKVLDVKHCYLQPSPSNDIRLEIKDIAKEKGYTYYNLLDHHGFLRNVIIRTSNTGQVMVILQVAERNVEAIHYILNRLDQKFDIASLNYIINQKRNETYFDQEVVNFNGAPHIEEQMQKPDGSGVLTFRVGPKSFYQTNSAQAEKLYHTAWKMAGLKGDELVYDLYTGTGTIASYVAGNAKKVVGIEYIEPAVEDARENVRLNNIDNAEFYAGDMKDLLTESFFDQHGKPQVVITDPPRAGMHEEVTMALLKAGPEKIVYVSCNPATQARDAAILSQKYDVLEVQPVDMFPHTQHVENVMLFKLKEIQ